MSQHELIILTVDQFKILTLELIEQAQEPLREEIRQLQSQVAHHKHAYTVEEVADQIGYKSQTVREFIKDGRVARNGEVVPLPAREITSGQYRILPTDLDRWLKRF